MEIPKGIKRTQGIPIFFERLRTFWEHQSMEPSIWGSMDLSYISTPRYCPKWMVNPQRDKKEHEESPIFFERLRSFCEHQFMEPSILGSMDG
jgi:hypothetical protein